MQLCVYGPVMEIPWTLQRQENTALVGFVKAKGSFKFNIRWQHMCQISINLKKQFSTLYLDTYVSKCFKDANNGTNKVGEMW